MDELIDFLQTHTQMARFTRSEVREIIKRLEEHGWTIATTVPKSDLPVV